MQVIISQVDSKSAGMSDPQTSHRWAIEASQGRFEQKDAHAYVWQPDAIA